MDTEGVSFLLLQEERAPLQPGPSGQTAARGAGQMLEVRIKAKVREASKIATL